MSFRWRSFRGGPGAANRPNSRGSGLMRSSDEEVQPFSLARSQAVAELMGEWERRLRGYDLFAAPVALEPAFLPFHPPLLVQEEVWEQLELEVAAHHEVPLAFVQVIVPAEQKVAPDSFAALLHSLGTLAYPVALEVIATCETVTLQIACAKGEEASVWEALRLAFPLSQSVAAADSQADALHQALATLPGAPSYRVVDLGLARPTYELLPLFTSWTPDPLLSLVGVLGSLQTGEVAGVQLLLSPARQTWGAEMAKLVALWRDWGDKDEPDAKSRKSQGQEMGKALRQKLVSPLWFAASRVFAATESRSSIPAFDLCQRLAAALPGSDAFLALDDEGYDARAHLLDVVARRSRRPGALLCAQEVGTLWHPPGESLAHPRLIRSLPATLPLELQTLPGVLLGALDDGSTRQEAPVVRWPDAWRTRHFYALGATRMGKSTLLLNMMAQDLAAGRGLCLIDPHGDLARDLLALVPPEREADVLFLDLSDAAFPPAIGLLDAADEWEERLLVSDLLSILRRLFVSSWGDRLEHLLRHALLTLLADKSCKHTLRDVRPLLSDEEFRARVLQSVRDPDLRLFWAREFPSYPASALSPLANKLGLLFSSPLVRNIAGGRASKLSFGELMRHRKVLIVDLSAGKIGNDSARFLGALLVSRLQLSAMHALRLERLDRPPFTLYVDEFHAFAVSSFETILSEAGKAGLHLVMANQFLEQLDAGLRTAILSNVGALTSFRVSADSARSLEREFGGVVGAETLVDLSRGEAVIRLGRAGNTVRIHTFPPPKALDEQGQAARIQRIIERTQDELCRPRAEVEAEIFGTMSSTNRAPSLEETAHSEPDAVKGNEHYSPLTEPPQDVENTAETTTSGGPQHFGWDDEEDG